MNNISIGDIPTVEQPVWGRSVGLVQSQHRTFQQPFTTTSGVVIPAPWQIAYETYGTLNAAKSNAILICHALSGDAHAAGWHTAHDARPGWFEPFIGPGRAFDSERYFIICSNILGGCSGTTGPASPHPHDQHAWGSRFPVLTIEDMVRAQACLLDALGIEKLLAVAGGSLGGMQALQWAASFGERVRGIIALATTARSSAMTIALNAVGRQAILSDPDWRGGDYYEHAPPQAGLATARRIGHISYLSEQALASKFDRHWQQEAGPHWSHEPEFAVESYLHYQGKAFVNRFDANTYLVITRAMDYFDLGQSEADLAHVWRPGKAAFFVAAWNSDWLYPVHESQAIVRGAERADCKVQHHIFESDRGHDSFLLNDEQLTPALRDWLETL